MGLEGGMLGHTSEENDHLATVKPNVYTVPYL